MNEDGCGVFDEAGNRWFGGYSLEQMRLFALGLSQVKGRITVIAKDGCCVYNRGELEMISREDGSDSSPVVGTAQAPDSFAADYDGIVDEDWRTR